MTMMLVDLDASELLFSLQLFVPSLLLVLLLTSFLPKSAQEDITEQDLPGIIPVVLPITLPRTPLLVTLLLLLSLSHAVSFTWMLVAFKLNPPLISLFTAGGGIIAWVGAAYSVWKAQGRRVGWAKAMGWVGLVGEGWMGAVRVWLFVKWTGSFPPGAFPLPSFLLLTLLSVRLLLLVLIIWALYNPVRDFIPAPRRRNGPSSASPSEGGERRGLLSEGGEAGSTKDGVLGGAGVGEGYGTFGESGEEQRIEGRGSASDTSLSQKPATPTATPLPEPASTESLVPITAASPADEDANPIDDISPPSLSPVIEHSETSSSPKVPEPVFPPTSTEDEPTRPSFAEVAAAAVSSSSNEPEPSSTSIQAPPPPPSPPKTSFPTSTSLIFPSLPESTEPSRSPSLDINTSPAPTSLVAPATPSAQPNPTSSHAVSPSASSTITDSPSVSTKEKRKRLASLSDMGRKMSDEGKGLVRRVSLMGKNKNSSSSSNSIPTLASTENLAGASPSPINSPGGRSSLSGAGGLPEGREGDGTSSFVSNASSGGGGGLKKRLSLLTRKSSSSSSTLPPSSSSTPAVAVEAEGAGAEGGGKEKKKPFVTKNGRNGKGKKTKSKK